jgi:hypothetical protein
MVRSEDPKVNAEANRSSSSNSPHVNAIQGRCLEALTDKVSQLVSAEVRIPKKTENL